MLRLAIIFGVCFPVCWDVFACSFFQNENVEAKEAQESRWCWRSTSGCRYLFPKFSSLGKFQWNTRFIQAVVWRFVSRHSRPHHSVRRNKKQHSNSRGQNIVAPLGKTNVSKRLWERNSVSKNEGNLASDYLQSWAFLTTTVQLMLWNSDFPMLLGNTDLPLKDNLRQTCQKVSTWTGCLAYFTSKSFCSICTFVLEIWILGADNWSWALRIENGHWSCFTWRKSDRGGNEGLHSSQQRSASLALRYSWSQSDWSSCVLPEILFWFCGTRQ